MPEPELPPWLANEPRITVTPSPTIPGMWHAWQGISEQEARRIYAHREITFHPPLPYKDAVAEIKRSQSTLVGQYERGRWVDCRNGAPNSGLQIRRLEFPGGPTF